jgi:RND family efflux transporter MFP subunit
MKKLNLILGFVVAVIVTSCSSQAAKSEHKASVLPPIKVKVQKVNKQAESSRYCYSGIIEPSVSTSLSFQSMGTVKSIFVEEGDVVKKGDVLAYLDATSMQSAYNAALASQKQALDAYERLKTVYDNGSLPEIKWEEIKSNLAKANASANMSKHNFENTKLKAPYDGVIGSRNIEMGSSVNPAITAFEIVDIENVYAKISVPENEISKFEKGMIGTVNIPAVGARNFDAKIVKVGILANRLSKTYSVKLSISNTDCKIKPGMVCDTDISLHKENEFITVPMQVVMNKLNENPYVFVLNKSEGKVNKRSIKVGTFTNSKVQVIAGLTEGEFVVVNGQQKLVDNHAVSF